MLEMETISATTLNRYLIFTNLNNLQNFLLENIFIGTLSIWNCKFLLGLIRSTVSQLNSLVVLFQIQEQLSHQKLILGGLDVL